MAVETCAIPPFRILTKRVLLQNRTSGARRACRTADTCLAAWFTAFGICLFDRLQMGPMKKHFLLTVLVLPLTLAAAVLMAAGFCVPEPWRSLFVNLAAGLVGSVITVFYVEKIIRRNEQHEWMKVMGHVGRQVNILANATTSSVRAALKLKMPASSCAPEVASDPRRLRTMMLDLIECDLLPQISGLGRMNQDDWRIFANNMIGSVKDAERLLSLFSRSIDPVIVGLDSRHSRKGASFSASVSDVAGHARRVLCPDETEQSRRIDGPSFSGCLRHRNPGR